MPVASQRQYLEMLDAARDGGYAYPAVNVTSSQTLNAALLGFASARSDGIVQITTSAATYFSGAADDAATGARAFAEFAHVVAAHSPVLIALHTDHATAPAVHTFLDPLLEASRERIGRGEPPLFNSHMFDGSALPLDENLRIARRLLDHAHELGLLFEFEIGIVGGEEDGIRGAAAGRPQLYSSTADALQVAKTLGSGERGRYLLAATFGNVHGRYAPGTVRLEPQILDDLQNALASRRPGNRFDFVFHGGSGSSSTEIAAAVANGVVKMNIDTDTQYAFTHAIEVHFAEATTRATEGVDKRIYDPREWGRKAEDEMAARVFAAAETLGSRGKTLAYLAR